MNDTSSAVNEFTDKPFRRSHPSFNMKDVGEISRDSISSLRFISPSNLTAVALNSVAGASVTLPDRPHTFQNALDLPTLPRSAQDKAFYPSLQMPSAHRAPKFPSRTFSFNSDSICPTVLFFPKTDILSVLRFQGRESLLFCSCCVLRLYFEKAAHH